MDFFVGGVVGEEFVYVSCFCGVVIVLVYGLCGYFVDDDVGLGYVV